MGTTLRVHLVTMFILQMKNCLFALVALSLNSKSIKDVLINLVILLTLVVNHPEKHLDSMLTYLH